MNRQVGPSIVLSVMIVCFFAVALYQPDPPRSSRAEGRYDSADANARSGALPKCSPAGQAARVEPAQAIRDRQVVPAQPVASASDSAITILKPSAAGASHPRGQDPDGSDGSQREERIEVGHQPGSAFTIVLANETLKDVARRVYGSSAGVDSLWRANRDALSRRDSPLAAGMVLRTPVWGAQSALRK
jgi:hypothetical protein